jgi:hypothetical protein
MKNAKRLLFALVFAGWVFGPAAPVVLGSGSCHTQGEPSVTCGPYYCEPEAQWYYCDTELAIQICNDYCATIDTWLEWYYCDHTEGTSCWVHCVCHIP